MVRMLRLKNYITHHTVDCNAVWWVSLFPTLLEAVPSTAGDGWAIKAIRRYGFTPPDVCTVYIWDNYLRGGSSESLFWKWSVVKPVVHPYPRLRTNRLKFDRVSWALYLFYDKRSAMKWCRTLSPHFNAYLVYKDLLEFRSESLGIDARLVPLQVKDPFSRFGKSLLQMPRSRPQWSRCIKIGIRAGRIPPK